MISQLFLVALYAVVALGAPVPNPQFPFQSPLPFSFPFSIPSLPFPTDLGGLSGLQFLTALLTGIPFPTGLSSGPSSIQPPIPNSPPIRHRQPVRAPAPDRLPSEPPPPVAPSALPSPPSILPSTLPTASPSAAVASTTRNGLTNTVACYSISLLFARGIAESGNVGYVAGPPPRICAGLLTQQQQR